MKKLFSTLLAGAVVGVLALTGCGGGTSSSAAESTEVPNPVVDYDTLEEAQAAVDFDVLVPGYVPEGFTQSAVSVIGGKLVQVSYANGESTILYRTAPSSQDAGDGIGISGDYNEYAVKNNLDIAEVTVDMKGDADNQWAVAQWKVGDMMYSLSFNPPVSTEESIKIIGSVE